MDFKAVESGVEGGERDTFLPVDLERLGEEFQGGWRRESQADSSWSSSQSSAFQPCPDSAAPQSTSLLLPPVLSLLEDVKDSEDCEDFSYSSEIHEQALVIAQKEEAREPGEEAEWMHPQKVRKPDAQKQAEFNFREGRFHRKVKVEQTEWLVESSEVEEGKEGTVERPKEEVEDLAPPTFFTFEETSLPPSVQTPPLQQSSQDPASSQAIVIEWEEFASGSCQQRAKSSSESLQPPISVHVEESAQTSAPQFSSAQASPRAAEEVVREKLQSPVSSESERDKEALLGTQASRRSTKLVRYRDVWPAFEQLDLTSYLQPEDSIVPSIPWWKRCCMGEREELNIEASRQQRGRIFALQRVKVRDEGRNWEMMMSVWKMCMSDKEDCNRQGSHWARLGFDGPAPFSTFQNANLLGLIQLLFFTSRYCKSQQFLSKLTQGHFPLARLSCAMTSAATQSLREGLLESWVYSGFSVYIAVNSYYAGLMVRCVQRWEKSWEKQWERLRKEVEMEGRRNPSAMLRLAQSKDLLQA